MAANDRRVYSVCHHFPRHLFISGAIGEFRIFSGPQPEAAKNLSCFPDGVLCRRSGMRGFSAVVALSLCIWAGVAGLLFYAGSVELLEEEAFVICGHRIRQMAAVLVFACWRRDLWIAVGVLEFLGRRQVDLYGPVS